MATYPTGYDANGRQTALRTEAIRFPDLAPAPLATTTEPDGSVVASGGQLMVANGGKFVPLVEVINTDGNTGARLFVGATDPAGYSPVPGDLWVKPS